MKRRKQTYAKAALLVLALFSLVLFWHWDWLCTTSQRLQPLDKYRIYDSTVVLDTSAPEKVESWSTFKWRTPISRAELLQAEEHLIWYPHQRLGRKAQPKKELVAKKYRPTTILYPVPVRETDQLDDFVVESGEWFHHPDSWGELNAATRRGAAHRASDFFSRHYGRTKPFLGEIPTSLCYDKRDYGIHAFGFNQLQIWKDFKLVNVNLPTPETPQVTIVAAGGVYNVRKAVYDHTGSISYRYNSYWAAIYAGSASSSRKFIVGRNVGELPGVTATKARP